MKGIQMMNSLNIALAEVSQILNLLGNEYINKIPYKFLKFMEENKAEHISISITEDNYENVELTRNAIIIISMLNLNYWVTDPEEKEKLLRIYQENDRKFLNKVPNYKNSDWLSNNREEKSFEKPKNETKYLINIEQQSVFTKVINFIKSLFMKK